MSRAENAEIRRDIIVSRAENAEIRRDIIMSRAENAEIRRGKSIYFLNNKYYNTSLRDLCGLHTSSRGFLRISRIFLK